MPAKRPDAKALLRSAARHARAEMPDVAFAARFLARDRRLPVYTVAAVLGVLHGVMNHREDAGESCASESPEQKLAVCAAILDFLYAGNPTGRPELDSFAEIAERFGIARPVLEPFAQGLATRLTTKRCATWVRLRRDRLPIAAAAAGALAAVLAPRPGSALDAGALKRLTDAALAEVLADDLYTLADHWKQGRLVIALDDLIAAGLTETDLTRFTAARATAGDPRWLALTCSLAQRIAALHDQGQAAWPTLEPSCQRALAIWTLAQRDRFTRWLAAGGDAFAPRPVKNDSTWRRLARLPGVVRVLSKSQGGSARKKKNLS